MKNLKLKAARAARDWSQQQLADAVGVSRRAARSTHCSGRRRSGNNSPLAA